MNDNPNQAPPQPPAQPGQYYPQQQHTGAPGSSAPAPYGAPPPQPGQYPQQPYYYPQPPPGQPGYLPPGQYPPPPPAGQYPYPPQQQQQPPYGYPPPQQPGYGYPPQQPAPGAPAGYGYGGTVPPPQGQYPPPQGYGAPAPPGGAPPAAISQPPSPGYVPGQMSDRDASKHVDALRKAMKGFGTDEETLIHILAKADPLYVAKLNHTYSQRLGRNLEKDVKSEVSGKLEDALVAFIRGPLMQDVHAVRNAVKGLGTNEDLLNDVLIGRSKADLEAIKRAYRETFGRLLEEDVRDDLSGRTKQLFTMILTHARPEDNPYAAIDQKAVDRDVEDLYEALVKRSDTDLLTVSQILTSRSDSHLRAVVAAYDKDNEPKLLDRIAKSTSGHLEDALLAILRGAVDPIERDAISIYKCFIPSLKESLLTERIVRLHWDQQRLEQVKAAFAKKYKRDLKSMIKANVSGDYQKALVAAVE
ncbi:hypothetical protein VTO42DRAFT_6078 [Malbranchea cinnamomea]